MWKCGRGPAQRTRSSSPPSFLDCDMIEFISLNLSFCIPTKGMQGSREVIWVTVHLKGRKYCRRMERFEQITPILLSLSPCPGNHSEMAGGDSPTSGPDQQSVD